MGCGLIILGVVLGAIAFVLSGDQSLQIVAVILAFLAAIAGLVGAFKELNTP